MFLRTRKLGVIALAAVVTLGITACGPPGGSGSDPSQVAQPVSTDVGSEKVELVLWDGAGLKDLDEALITAFNKKYPNITITGRYDPDNVSAQNGPRVISSADAPDLARVTDVMSASKGKHLTDLEPYSEAYGWDRLPDGQLEQYRVSADGQRGTGKLYAVPDGFTVTGVFYNRELAAKVGMNEAPKTIGELETYLAAAKDAGIAPIMAGNQDGGTSFAYQGLLNDSMTADTVQKWIFQAQGATIDQPTAVTAAQTLQSWGKSGYYPEGINGIDNTMALGRFTNGEGMVMFNGNWAVAAMVKSMGDNVGFFAIPSAQASNPGNGATSPATPFGIPANAKHKNEAAAFLNWLDSPEARQIQVDHGFAPLGASDVSSPTTDSKVAAEVLAVFGELTTAGVLTDFINNATAGIQASGWIPNLQLLMDNKQSPQEFVTAIERAYTEEIGK